MDPNILEWLKKTTENEQNFRHEETARRTKLFSKSENKVFSINVLGITFAFLIIVSLILFSYLLIKEDHIVTGSIFGGVSLITYASSLFTNKSRSKK